MGTGNPNKELGERTLITKGTLTGVIERLEQKGRVVRERSRLLAVSGVTPRRSVSWW